MEEAKTFQTFTCCICKCIFSREGRKFLKNLKRHPLGLCHVEILKNNKEKVEKYININHVMNECWSWFMLTGYLAFSIRMKYLFPNFSSLSFPYIFFHYLLRSSALSSVLLLFWVASNIRKVIVEGEGAYGNDKLCWANNA